MLTIENVARVAHEVNRAYCLAHGDLSQASWENAPDWQKVSAINGVRFVLGNPQAGPGAQHAAWMAEKLAAGWTVGPVKDAEKLEHPCLVPFDELPKMQQIKDVLFRGVVKALAPLIGGKRIQNNTGAAHIDVMVQPVAALETLQACDSAGRPLVLASVAYDAVLPPNGWPCSVRIGRPGAEAVYRFGALDDLMRAALRAAEREAACWKETASLADRELVEIYALPIWQQRQSWLVRAAVWISARLARVLG